MTATYLKKIAKFDIEAMKTVASKRKKPITTFLYLITLTGTEFGWLSYALFLLTLKYFKCSKIIEREK